MHRRDATLRSGSIRLVLVAAAVLHAPSLPAVQPTPDPDRPRLMVLLVVDQMRRDYVERFQASWTGGLRRLIDDGAVYANATYPYLATWTCSGHATIATGSYPAVHGVIQNVWFDRALGRSVACAADPDVPVVGYGVPRAGGAGGVSPRQLLTPTLGESLRAQIPGARTAALSLKDRSAVMLAGHEADVVIWFDNGSRGWATSTAYADAPLPFLADFIARNPINRQDGDVWRQRLAPSLYLTPDDGAGEDPPEGWTTRFPHVLDDLSQGIDAPFYERWRESPASDAYLERMAEATIAGLALGERQVPDLLAVSFSALDNVGHDFGPDSQEVQDVLAHLDDTIGLLLGFLDERIGPNGYVVALTADHGVQSIPEQAASRGLDAGRISVADAQDAVEAALGLVVGPGPHVARIVSSDLYFDPAQAAAILSNPAAVSAARRALMSVPGILRVIAPDELAVPGDSARPGADTLLDAARRSYVPGRSGDLLIVPRPGWIIGPRTLATNHGSPAADDRDVPLVLLGAGIAAGRYAQDASPADIAPTLAVLAGITLNHAQGRVLHEALGR